MTHPCDRYSCPECVQGQCFGDGCKANPILDNTQNNNTNTKEKQ